jgi:hypothetical protein
MSSERLGGGPAFVLNGVTWRCWVTDSGQRYEWRSTCGRYRAGRYLVAADPANYPKGKAPSFIALHWARAGERIVGQAYTTLRLAMEAATSAALRMVA